MPQVVGGMEVELPLIRCPHKVKLMGARERHAVYLISVLLWNVVFQVAVIGADKVFEQLQVGAVWHKLVKLAHKYRFLIVEK